MWNPFAKKPPHPANPEEPPHAPALQTRIAEISSRIDALDWETFKTAYGNAQSVPVDLKLLLFGSLPEAMDATHRLWCSLCYQHAYLFSAAEPAVDFILIALAESRPSLQVELLDIILGFVISHNEADPFSIRIVTRLRSLAPAFVELRSHVSPEVAGFASRIGEQLDTIGTR